MDGGLIHETAVNSNDEAAVAKFTVTGSVCAQLSCRLMGLFAQQDVMPRIFTIRRSGAQIRAFILVETLCARKASIIAHKMKMLFTVSEVSLQIQYRSLDDRAVAATELTLKD